MKKSIPFISITAFVLLIVIFALYMSNRNQEAFREFDRKRDAELKQIESETPRKMQRIEAEINTTYRNAVPAEAMAKIKKNAERIFPNDYTMQEFKINQDIEAYQRMHSK